MCISTSYKVSLNSYNQTFKDLSLFPFIELNDRQKRITSINYNHPLLKNAFYSKVSNFQYPNTQNHYPISSKNSSSILSYENNLPFISQLKNTESNVYLFSGAIHKNNSNFVNSPLIVPVFYNFGKTSFQHSKIYYYLNEENNIEERKIDLKEDHILDDVVSLVDDIEKIDEEEVLPVVEEIIEEVIEDEEEIELE